MPSEPNHGITFAQEVFLTARRDGELLFIEEENGHITRYAIQKTNRSISMQLFGADKPPRLQAKVTDYADET